MASNSVRQSTDRALSAYREMITKGVPPIEAMIIVGCALGVMLGGAE